MLKKIKKKTYIKAESETKDSALEEAAEDNIEEDKQASGEDDLLSDQLQDLRGELKSQLPEPEEFLSFEKAIADREGEDDSDSQADFPTHLGS